MRTRTSRSIARFEPAAESVTVHHMSVAPPVKQRHDPELRVPSLPPIHMQELWFATRRRPWRSLAVIPADAAHSAAGIARALAEVGGFIGMKPVHFIDAQGMDLAALATLVMELGDRASSSSWTMNAPARPGAGWDPSSVASEKATVVALESVVANPLVLPVALAADAVLLTIELHATPLEEARRTVEMIGRERVVGSVLLRR
jgi:hypothetical protein